MHSVAGVEGRGESGGILRLSKGGREIDDRPDPLGFRSLV
jgi:hypothetical protein